jgi:hypothetical protein
MLFKAKSITHSHKNQPNMEIQIINQMINTNIINQSNDIEANNNKVSVKLEAIDKNIYRYAYNEDFVQEISAFAKIHQYDDRHDFKNAWNIWIKDNAVLINEEVRRHQHLGYDGDIMDKMYKSARYYFRKKSTEIKVENKRKIYVASQKDLLESMNTHIKDNIHTVHFKPSDAFDEFCKLHINSIKEQIAELYRSGVTDSAEIKTKIKKIYKNRYYAIMNKK